MIGIELNLQELKTVGMSFSFGMHALYPNPGTRENIKATFQLYMTLLTIHGHHE